MGVIISGAVLPASLTLMWSRQSWAAATFSPPLALMCSLIAWLVTAKKEFGELTVDSTGSNNPMLAGNVVSLLAPTIFIPVLSFAFKSPKYDWLSMKAIRRADDHDLADKAHVDLELVPGERRQSVSEEQDEQKKLLRAGKIARSLTVFLTIALLVLWPMPMYGSGYIFSKPFFTGWVTVGKILTHYMICRRALTRKLLLLGILWLFCSAFCVGLYPLWEGRHTSSRTFMSIFRDLTGRGKVTHGQAAFVESEDEKQLDTPPEKQPKSTET
jgi:urea-proton symporter